MSFRVSLLASLIAFVLVIAANIVLILAPSPVRTQVVLPPTQKSPPSETRDVHTSPVVQKPVLPLRSTDSTNAKSDQISFPTAGNQFGFTLVRFALDGRPIMIPMGWQLTQRFEQPNDHVSVWQDPQSKAFIRVDRISPTDVHDALARYHEQERRFKSSHRYQYSFKQLRTGPDAYLNGSIWNFTLRKDKGPEMKRTVAYFLLDHDDYAVSTGSEKTAPPGYGRLFTEVLDSLRAW